jgi:2-polyprenyl-6-methoxyphenol hydroxylase-like FAD-dependent oxidoreductase
MTQLDNTGKVGTQMRQAVGAGTGAKARQAAVVGAGIGGLAAGIALSRAGWEVAVYESAIELHPLGAGLSIWPNGVRALRALGLGAVADGAPRTGGALRRADGSLLAEFDPDLIEQRYGAPLLGLHRAELHEALVDTLGAERLRLGMPLESLAGDELHFADGSTQRADLIVGADGIRSTVREALVGDGEPRDSGIVAFRGVAPGSAAPTSEGSTPGEEGAAPAGAGAASGRESASPSGEAGAPAGEWWGPGTAAGLLPLRDGRVYWYVAFRGEPERSELPDRIAKFDATIQEIVARTPDEDVLVHRLYDRKPLDSWSQGNTTLLGDAAHPMLPFLGQGACSALEDAVALGAAVAANANVPTALAAYEQARVKRTAALVAGSRRASRVAVLGSALGRGLRDALLPRVPESSRLRQLDPFLKPAAP